MKRTNVSFNRVSPGSKRKSVAVAMSGGVDSSVAAALLVNQGFDVIGIMLRLWNEPESGNSPTSNRCCTPEQMADARRIALKLQIPFYVLDVQDYFYKSVVQFFLDEYRDGRTPNPCIECNRVIRFDYLLNQALSLGVDYLATGHYARVQHDQNGYHLYEGIDKSKDQSYVLHVLGQDQLAHVLFPVGDYKKVEIRQLASQFGFNVAGKSDSMDLCFLKDGDHRRFIMEHNNGGDRPGPIMNIDGATIGQHSGLSNYTIGQRKGLGIAVGQPVYVQRKDSQLNALIVSAKSSLHKDLLSCGKVNWIAGQPPRLLISGKVKIRYRAKAMPATIEPIGHSQARVRFDQPVFGVTPGQGAVFYIDEECIGGGIIKDEDL